MRALSGCVAGAGGAGCSRRRRVRPGRRRAGARRPSRPPTQAYQAQDYTKAAELYEEAAQADPDSAASGLLLPGQQLRQPVQAEPERGGRERRAAAQGGRELSNRRRQAGRPRRSEQTRSSASARSSILAGGLRRRQAERPAKAEPIVQKMIQLEPGEPSNYFALAKIYEDAGAYAEAEQTLRPRESAKPNDPAVYMTLARLLQPPGAVRQDDRGARAARAKSNRTTPRPSRPSPPTTGTKPAATSS